MTDVLSLASGFGEPDRKAWLALVEKTLKGAGLETLTCLTRDGLPIAPLYSDGPVSPVRSGPRDVSRPWDIRCETRHTDPARANRDVMADLEGGAASVLIRLDPTGRDGVAIGDQSGLARVLDDVLLDLAPIALDAGFLGVEAADWLGALAKGGPNAPLCFHLDPISAFAIAGASPGPIESHILHAATTGARMHRAYPKASLFLASGRAVHEAGGTEAQELAFALASALTYAKALIRAGVGPDDAFAAITLGLTTNAEYFLSIAKLRAARILWAKLTSAVGVAPNPAMIEARSSDRMLTTLDAWTNLLRLASAGVGAGLGCADVIILAPFTDAIGLPGPLARRQARNIQLVLMEESHLGRVADPAGGAWFIEDLTDKLARSAWAKFQAIEAQGGVAAALESGLIARDVGKATETEMARLDDGRQQILGVTKFRSPDDATIKVETPEAGKFAVTGPNPRKPGPDSLCPPMPPVRLAAEFESVQ